MLFLQRYQLKRLLSAGEINTFSGLQLHPEQEVYIHMIPNGQKNAIAGNLLQDLLSQPEILPNVLEVGELAGTWFIVTEPISHFSTFREWLQQHCSSAKPHFSVEKPLPQLPPPMLALNPPIPLTLVPQSDLPPGEFTRLFSRVNPSSERTTLYDARAKENKLRDKKETKEESEFTRSFGTAKSEPNHGPGEFDEIFPPRNTQKPDIQEKTQKPTRAQEDQTDWEKSLAPNSEADDMPGFFNQPYQGKRVDVDERRALHNASGVKDNPEPFREAGQFTRIFGPRTPASSGGAVMTPPAGRSKGVSSASKLFESNQAAASPEAQPISDGGSYTKVIAPKTKPSSPVAPAPSSPPPPPEPTNQKLRIALIIVGGVCGVALLSAVLFLIFKRL